jgi:hypothetical protein
VVFDRLQGVRKKPLPEGTSIIVPFLQVRFFQCSKYTSRYTIHKIETWIWTLG